MWIVSMFISLQSIFLFAKLIDEALIKASSLETVIIHAK